MGADGIPQTKDGRRKHLSSGKDGINLFAPPGVSDLGNHRLADLGRDPRKLDFEHHERKDGRSSRRRHEEGRHVEIRLKQFQRGRLHVVGHSCSRKRGHKKGAAPVRHNPWVFELPTG